MSWIWNILSVHQFWIISLSRRLHIELYAFEFVHPNSWCLLGIKNKIKNLKIQPSTFYFIFWINFCQSMAFQIHWFLNPFIQHVLSNLDSSIDLDTAYGWNHEVHVKDFRCLTKYCHPNLDVRLHVLGYKFLICKEFHMDFILDQ